MGRAIQTIGVLAVLAVISGSAAMNYEFASSLGTTRQNARILGGLSVAGDLLKAVLPILIAAAWALRAWWRALAGCVLFALTLMVGFASAVGFGAANRGQSATLETLAAALRDAQRDESEARRLLATLPAARPAGEIAAELAGHKTDRAWGLSKGCTEVTAPASRELCKAMETLKGEAARAAEADVLRRKLERLGGEIARLRQQGAGRDADPQVSVLRRLLGRLAGDVDSGFVRSGLAAVFALLVETISAFGLYACGVGHGLRQTGLGRQGRPEADEAEVVEVTAGEMRRPPPPLALIVKPLGVDRYMQDRLGFDDGAVLSVRDAFADYQSEARRRGLPVLAEAEFASVWDGICRHLKIEGEGGVYRGIWIGAQEHGQAA